MFDKTLIFISKRLEKILEYFTYDTEENQRQGVPNQFLKM